jgi:hypothetical protein
MTVMMPVHQHPDTHHCAGDIPSRMKIQRWPRQLQYLGSERWTYPALQTSNPVHQIDQPGQQSSESAGDGGS